jgi:hypothetical protein
MRVVMWFALFCLVDVTDGFAACSKPETPACAIARVPFETDLAADDCRKDMLLFRDQMDAYASCLAPTSAEDERIARDDYENVRTRFNKRARGEFD